MTDFNAPAEGEPIPADDPSLPPIDDTPPADPNAPGVPE